MQYIYCFSKVKYEIAYSKYFNLSDLKFWIIACISYLYLKIENSLNNTHGFR